jgi:hypothetical protein
MWILSRTHEVLGINIKLYFTLSQNQELTTDINQAFQLRTEMEAKRLNQLLLGDVSFNVEQVPQNYRTRGTRGIVEV